MNTNETPFAPANACEAAQWEISQSLDEARTLPADVIEHLQTCPECAAFAGTWEGEGTLATLLNARLPEPDPALTARILQAVRREDEQTNAPARFAESVRPHLLPVAAALALAALAWWLLDPRVAPTPGPAIAASLAPAPAPVTASRQVARLQKPLTDERLAIQHASVEGVSHVRDILTGSLAVLQ